MRWQLRRSHADKRRPRDRPGRRADQLPGPYIGHPDRPIHLPPHPAINAQASGESDLAGLSGTDD